MRELTLNEKITIKGLLSEKGLQLPKLTMEDAVYFWSMCMGYRSITHFYKRSHRHGRSVRLYYPYIKDAKKGNKHGHSKIIYDNKGR